VSSAAAIAAPSWQDLRRLDARPPAGEVVRDLVTIAGWVGLLGAGLWLAHGPIATHLGTPSITDPRAWPAWVGSASTDVVTFAVMRLVVTVLVWWLVGATAVGVIARLAGWGGLARIADVLSVDAAGRLVRAGVGLTLAIQAVIAIPTAAAPALVVETASATPLDDAASSSKAAIVVPATPGSMLPEDASTVVETSPAVVMADQTDTSEMPAHAEAPAALQDDAVWAVSGIASADVSQPVNDGTGLLSAQPAHDDDPIMAASAAAAQNNEQGVVVAARSATWQVRPGDHLWRIAEEVVTTSGGDASGIVSYWRRLIEANRHNLVDPANPDLLHPGQAIDLPAFDHEGPTS